MSSEGVEHRSADPRRSDARPGLGLLTLLIVIDLILIALHLSQKYLGHPQDWTFDLGWERSYGDFAQYVELTWALVMLATLVIRRRAAVYAAWAMVCLYYLLDDLLMIHETAGPVLAAGLPLAPGSAGHVGELAWTGAVGLVLVLGVAVTHHRAGPRDRAASRMLAVLFAVLVFFGIVVDGVHHLLLPAPVFDAPFTALEDGGELLGLSLVVTFLFTSAYTEVEPTVRGVLRRQHAARPA